MPTSYYSINRDIRLRMSTMYEYFTSEMHRQRAYDAFDSVTKRYQWPPGVNATGRRMLFTGPDGIRNQKVTVRSNHRYVGIGTMSPEGTSELDYIYRPATADPPSLRPKHRRVGEIGWGIPRFSDISVTRSRQQLQRGEFRQSAEDRHTHLYQNPWMPHPTSSMSESSVATRPSSSHMSQISRNRMLPSIERTRRPQTVMERRFYGANNSRNYESYRSSTSDEYQH